MPTPDPTHPWKIHPSKAPPRRYRRTQRCEKCGASDGIEGAFCAPCKREIRQTRRAARDRTADLATLPECEGELPF